MLKKDDRAKERWSCQDVNLWNERDNKSSQSWKFNFLRKQEEEREAIRQKLREKVAMEQTEQIEKQNQTIHFFQYKIERPRDESIEEPEEESSESESEEEEEDEEEIDEEKEREREYLEELSKKIAIIMTSIIAGFFSMYLLTSFVHLKYVF